MKAFIWGNNQVVTVAENKNDATKNAIARIKDHPSLVKTIVNADPIEVSENTTRILYTEWSVG